MPSASNQFHFKIGGPARIVGVDNGRQASRECYQAQKNGRFKRKAFHGRGVLLVQSLEQAVSVRPLRLYTAKGTYPQLPSSVLVDYEFGGAKRVKVVWEEIPKEDLEKFHEFTVSGQLEGDFIKSCLWQCRKIC